MQTVQQIRGLLSGMTAQELRQVNSDVVAHLNHRQGLTQTSAMANLRVGTIAEFNSSKLNKTIRIRITRLNQKTVTGQQIHIPDGTDTIGTWKVAPSLLRVVGD